MELFQYFSEYSELNNTYKSLKRYNIFKKKSISKNMKYIEEVLRGNNIYDLLNALYNYIYLRVNIITYTFDDNPNYVTKINLRDNGYIYISSPNYYIEYSVNTKTFHINYKNKSFYVQYKQPISNKNIESIYNTVEQDLYDKVIQIISIF